VIVRPVLCRPFIGRREELAYLRERRIDAGSSHGALVLIAGDAGVGKSRLIAEFCATLTALRWRIGEGPCHEDGGRPYGPVLDALARLDGAPAELAPAASKTEQFDAIYARVAAIAARNGVVLIIEDIHWADAATLDVLAYLAGCVQRSRIVILASFRPDALHPDHPATRSIAKIARVTHAGRIDLHPLEGVELRTFIDEALNGIALPDETRRAIAIAGDGNPFFTEELLKSAVERNATRTADRARAGVPPTVRATLLDRLQPFDDTERRVMRQAAAIGRSFGLDLLASTLDAEPGAVLPVLRRARDFQLVEETAPSVFRFRHGLTRDAIYGEYLAAELRPLHRSIALALEQSHDDGAAVEALAYHWWAAGDEERAVRYNERAGDAATRLHAHEDAIAFYDRALATQRIDRLARATLVEKIAERRVALGWTAEANETYTAAANLFREEGATDREAAARVRAAITGYTLKLSAPTAPLEEMLARIDARDYVARSRVHLGLAWLMATFWFPARAAAHLAEVDSRAREEQRDVAIRYHNVAAWVAMTNGNREGFRREHAAWLDAARANHALNSVASAHYNGAMCFAFFGLHEEAAENIAHAVRVSRESRSLHGERSANAIAALCAVMAGDLAHARAAVGAVPTTAESQVTAAIACAWGTLAGAYLDDRALIETWFDGFADGAVAGFETECAPGFAEILVRRGRERDAAAVVHRAIPDCELPRGMTFTFLAAARYGAPPDRARAREYLARAADAPVETCERPALALFDAIERQRDGRAEDAANLARVAADGFRRLRFPLLEAEARELAGEIEEARAIYRRCGAAYHVRRLDGAAQRSAGAGDTLAFADLSSREREIAMLAVRGRSNAEIASLLSISVKTVEKHLASTYAKLGVASRMQLVARVDAAR